MRVFSAALVALALGTSVVPATAGEVVKASSGAGPSTPIPDRHAWFKSLTQPDTGASCCDLSDCRRTQADWRQGQWWAMVDGTWTPIPPNKELNKKSIDGDAYVCSGIARTIFCFVKPDLGS